MQRLKPAMSKESRPGGEPRHAFGISSFRVQPVTDKLFPCAFSLHTSLPRASALALVAPRDFGSPSRESDPRWPPGVGLINLNLHHLRFPLPYAPHYRRSPIRPRSP